MGWSTVAVGYHYSDQRTTHCENERSRRAVHLPRILSQVGAVGRGGSEGCWSPLATLGSVCTTSVALLGTFLSHVRTLYW